MRRRRRHDARRGPSGAARWVPDAAGIDELRSAVHDCRGCELWRDATQAVFSQGAPGAALMLVGEQPGDKEDLAGEPFVGPAGRVLDDALADAGIDGASAYVTNAVKHFRFERRGKRRIHEKARRRAHRRVPAVAGGVPLEAADAARTTVVVTVHPSSILRIREEEERRAGFRAFVADLRTAADLAG
ncbi:uracil-DNA glycosylase family protein [Microbacterium sp. EF45047]|uniref:uracil-DNA glycosylase family protein n=1 Tax=Microbacterium sp. EF45047 TaxID=2809708 RepID=UPI002348F633|nr:uracil-DNA glycosylase family protein [Microbacterium sp. EF45047]